MTNASTRISNFSAQIIAPFFSSFPERLRADAERCGLDITITRASGTIKRRLKIKVTGDWKEVMDYAMRHQTEIRQHQRGAK